MDKPVIKLTDAALRFGERSLWENMNLGISAGEFIAILGPNGSGKSSFLRVLLGLDELSAGSATIYDKSPSRGNNYIGYVPQQRTFDADIPIRGVDLVELGLNGHKWGMLNLNSRNKNQVNRIIKEIGASDYAQRPLGKLSGGEQQRLRIAQALVSDPKILICDEPFLSLDLKNQEAVSDLINKYRKKNNTTVLFVTHDINPIINIVDRVLYIARGKWSIGLPKEVLTDKTLTELYNSKVSVFNVDGRIFIVGGDDIIIDNEGHHHHHHHTKHHD